MPHTAAAPDPTQAHADPVYLHRDTFMREYQPASEREKMMVNHIAQCWLRLQRGLDAETRMLQETDLLELIKTASEPFTRLSRYITECERAWRQALAELRRLQRHRLSQAAGRGQSTSHRAHTARIAPIRAVATANFNAPEPDPAPEALPPSAVPSPSLSSAGPPSPG